MAKSRKWDAHIIEPTTPPLPDGTTDVVTLCGFVVNKGTALCLNPDETVDGCSVCQRAAKEKGLRYTVYVVPAELLKQERIA